MLKTYKYKLNPNRKQRESLRQTLDICRELYNMGLEQRRGQRISQYEQEKQLTQLKAAFPEYKVVYAHVLQNVFARLNRSFENFFRRVKSGKGKAGFPRFKSRDRYDSFNFKNTGFSLDGKILSLSKIGNVKVRLSRPLPQDSVVKTCSIKRTASGWFACLAVEYVPVSIPENTTVVGVDVGIANFAALSDGTFIENPRIYQHAQAELRRAQRRVARRKKGSHSRHDAVLLLQKVHQRIFDRRQDFLHKESTKLIQKYGTIVFEDLNVAAMSRSNLSKQILDASWSMFKQLSTYKAAEAGRRIENVPPQYTSQACPSCGHICRENRKTQEKFLCVECGHAAHADTNAAINISARAEPLGVNVGRLSPCVA